MSTVTLQGSLQPINGAVLDLEKGVTGTTSVPMAYIAGTVGFGNLNGLSCTLCVAEYLRVRCGAQEGDPLANFLTNTDWPTVFAFEDNDAIVPESSELNLPVGSPLVGSPIVAAGVIHSPGIEALDFAGPSVLETSSGVPDKVVDLLNEKIDGSDFQH